MTQIAFVGNITAPADIRFTQNGKAVASVTVAVNRKKGDKEESDFHRVTLWEGMAENAGQLTKGTRVVVIGRLTSKEYQDREGNTKTGWDVTADAFGPDLRFATVEVTKTGPAVSQRSNQAESHSTTAWDAPAGGAGYGDDTPF